MVELIPLFPLMGALLMLLFGRRLPKTGVNIVCVGAVLASFAVSLPTAAQGPQERILFEWLPLAHADWAYAIDPLSSLMILIVTGISSVIHVYSIGYMADDRGYYRFFGYLNLFVFFMLLLVMANNLALLFVGWEGVGLCSYLLIGFYFKRQPAGFAGMKAFVVNRVGDAAFLLGMLVVLAGAGSVRFADLSQVPAGLAPLAALLLFIGATGKSAQFPLHVWLPDAMEGPTPVSALIHAATMVTAGVYLVARTNVLFTASPEVLAIVAIVGAFTAILAASIALVQNDIKRVLAYSTVSQLGFMFMALGVGAYWVAIFHLFTHAFFKALLFLGAGSVIHGTGGEQDMRKMGGLRKAMPVTHAAMLVGALAISGIPGLAGFFSKDEILSHVYHSPHGSTAIYSVGLATALMTAFYMWRLMTMTFYREGSYAVHPHESPRVMTAPLVILAIGSALAGYPHENFRAWLAPVFPSEAAAHPAPGTEWILMGLALAAALLGILLSRFEIKGQLASVLRHNWYVDEAYNSVFVEGLAKGGGAMLGRFDARVVDGGVNGAGWLARMLSQISIFWDTWVVDGLVRFVSFTVGVLSYPARILQSGRVQTYALYFVFGALLMLGVYVTR
ncbi:MAG TPA: NADH-quinone oxidoreductase subunit L [Bryobacteraceae bacterium]|nr:NADH-quinone oxidoreductase subunit L [Bryobacteraceae bacterium]